jgi:hypothetical protein
VEIKTKISGLVPRLNEQSNPAADSPDELSGCSQTSVAMTASRGAVRVAARKALLQLMEPLSAFVIDAGLSASDMCLLLREAAVKSVAKSQLEMSQRTNISGIAATTGIPRAEISRILKQKPIQGQLKNNRRQQSTNRILARWYGEPKFRGINGQPATLNLYGRGATFESLVRMYGRGLSARAVLDELLRSRVVEVLPGQRIRAKASSAVHFGLSPHIVKSFGDRASELLSTMLSHIRESESPRFLATATVLATPDMLPFIRRELANRSAEFLSEVRESSAIAPRKHGSRTVGVTIFYHERERQGFRKKSIENRTNFRRRPLRQG